MLDAVIKKNDKKARWLIGIFSVVIFCIIAALGRVKLGIDPGFDGHIFAQINAIVNSAVAIILVTALVAVKQKKYLLHKRLMLTAMVLSIIFLLSYVTHH